MPLPDGRVGGYAAAPSTEFLPALDGIRAASVVLVLLSHLGLGGIVPGGFGVTCFFFVSGLLISRQLLAERAATGRIALGRFYVRRLLRLYPALIVMVALGGALFVAVGGRLTGGQVAAALFYYANYYGLAGGFRTGLPGIYHPYSILWSLSVEEHYYILFPVLVAVTAGSRLRFAGVMLLLIVAVTLWRRHVMAVCTLDLAHCLGGNALYRVVDATDTRIDAILYGAVLTTLLGTRLQKGLLGLLGNPASLAAGIALIVATLLVRAPVFRETLRFNLQGLGLFLVFGAVLFAPWLAPVRAALSIRPARLLGRWSYGLYLWHWVLLVVVSALVPAAMWQDVLDDHPGRLWSVAIAPALVAASLTAAAASYYGVERPMLSLRRRFGSHATADRGR